MEDEVQQALLQEFISESGDALQKIESGLLELETHPTPELIHNVFRFMHTVKGNCLMLGFSQLETLTHVAENLLENLRNYQVDCCSHVLSLLLRVVDEVRDAMICIGRDGTEPALDTSVLQEQLARACSPGRSRALIEGVFDDAESSLSIDPGIAENGSDTKDISAHADVLDDGFIRLPVKKLDEFLDILASINTALGFWRTRIAVNDISTSLDGLTSGLEDVGQQMSALQDTILRYRLEPIGRVWCPYQRLVRDLAVSMRKRVLLVTTGEETEVDRSVLMAIKDPLGHLVRNAIVHGIETPEQRQYAGKPKVGRVELSASQEYGQITLTVRDDGAGLDVDKILATVMARKIVSPSRLDKLSEEEICQLIFLPGISTSSSVDNISGRGTGLDVVKSALTAVGGSVQVRSEAGQGSCFEMQIPQSLAMVSTLLVEVQNSVLALPQAQVVEVAGLAASEAGCCITTNLGAPAFIFRETCVPLYLLRDIVCARRPWSGVGEAQSSLQELTGEGLNIVVLQHGSRRLALQVDGLREVADLVVKPLHRYLRDIAIVFGGAVLADGKVAFLLDVKGMIDWIDSMAAQQRNSV